MKIVFIPIFILLLVYYLDSVTILPARNNHSLGIQQQKEIEYEPDVAEKVIGNYRYPDLNVLLASGEVKHIKQIHDNDKYLFLIYFKTKKIKQQQLITLDSLMRIYESKLIIIGLLEGGTARTLKKLNTDYSFLSVSVPVLDEWNGNSGILYSKQGILIKEGMSSRELMEYLELHVGKAKAKF